MKSEEKTTTAIYSQGQNCAYGTFIGPFIGAKKEDEFIANAKELLKILREKKTNKQINNILKMEVIGEGIKTYLQTEWFPEAKAAGLKYFAFVAPEDYCAQIGTNTVNKDAHKKWGIEVEYFKTDLEARNWLNKRR